MTQTISINDQTIDAVVYTKNVITMDIIDFPAQSRFGIAYYVNYTASGATHNNGANLLWSGEAGLEYQTIKDTYTGSGEAQAMADLVAAADGNNLFDNL